MGALQFGHRKREDGLTTAWGNYVIFESGCVNSWISTNSLLRYFKPNWAFLNDFKNVHAYLRAVNCSIPRVSKILRDHGITPLPSKDIYVHFRCSDSPFNFSTSYCMVTRAYVEFAMREALLLAPNAHRVLIESCSHHTTDQANKPLTTTAANKRVCARFAQDFAQLVDSLTPGLLVEVVCFPEVESQRRMLGAAVLVVTMPSTFSFVAGCTKGKAMITPKTMGALPKWSTEELNELPELVPWTMYDGACDTDVIPVMRVPNYYQFDYAAHLATGAITSRGNQPWIDRRDFSVKNETTRTLAFASSLAVLTLLVALIVALGIKVARS
jgi:hypothetical protein